MCPTWEKSQIFKYFILALLIFFYIKAEAIIFTNNRYSSTHEMTAHSQG
jgi:hypothetical protein